MSSGPTSNLGRQQAPPGASAHNHSGPSYAAVAASTPASTTPAAAPSSGAVALPKRKKDGAEGEGNGKPVWSLEAANGATAESTAVPLAAKCDLHHRERTICCRELKGDDDRSLIDPDIVRDIIIGLADGLTVPFALTAGLSSLGSSKLVYTAGVAELVSGAISMGVGGYLSAQAERDHFRYLRKTTRERVLRSCSGEMEREVAGVLKPLGLDESLCRRVAGALLGVEATLPPPAPIPSITRKILSAVARKPRFSSFGDEERQSLLAAPAAGKEGEEDEDKGLTAFLLKFGEGLEEVTDARLFISAFTIGAAYFFGGLIPLIPYFIFDTARMGLLWSIGITTVILLVFGVFKTYYTGAQVGTQGYLVGAFSTLAVGGAAAAASFGIVRALEGKGE